MKKLDISFRHFDGSGPQSIYWHDGPYGDAIESNKVDGVGWFSAGHDLLGVEIKVIQGKVKFVTDKKKKAG